MLIFFWGWDKIKNIVCTSKKIFKSITKLTSKYVSMYSETMYSDLGLFWQYTTYIWNFRSYFLNKRPSSMGLSMHDSRFFKKLLELKKEKYHIKCDRCRILEIYDSCLNYSHSLKNAIVFWDLKVEFMIKCKKKLKIFVWNH